MKKTLALVLALVMVIGLMAIPVKADFTDSSSIEYTEAVDVLSAIGVINGFENGSFDPAGNLTREQAAKIVAYLLLGEKNADALVATSAPFSDVAADRWSAGYIAYCVNEGIINGRDAKTFDPTGKVTGYEFAKLMLGCLGYSSKIEQYVGASWAINVAKTALDIDLFDGNDGANYNAPMTREEAALYAFNTLKATLVDYDSQGTSIDLGNGVIISTGASDAEEVGTNSDTDAIADDGFVQFAEKYFEDLGFDSDEDDFGRPASIWEFDGEDVGTYADEADLTYTAAVEYDDVYNDTDEEAATATVYVDGIQSLNVALEDVDTEFGGNGALTEVYYGDGAITVVVINTYVGQIGDWTEADEDENVEESINVTALTGDGAAADLASNFETVAFSEDDVDDETIVLYTAAYDDGVADAYVIQSVVVPESVTAFVTKASSTSFVAGGTTYKYSVMNDDTNVAAYESGADDAVIYLDSYGYAIYVDSDANSSDDYAYVAAVGEDTDAWTSTTYYAKLVLASGEVVVAEVEDDASAVTVDETVYGDYNADGDVADDVVLSLEGRIVTYDVDSDDVYTLTLASVAANTITNASTFELNKSTSKIRLVDAATDTNVYANSSTVFVVAESDATSDDAEDKDYTAYTGIANVPSMEEAEIVVAALDDGKAAFVYIENAGSSDNVDDVVYIQYDAEDFANVISGEDSDDYIELAAIVDGKVTTLSIAVGSDAYDVIDAADADIIRDSITTNADGLVTKLGSATTTANDDEIFKVADGALQVGAEYYTLADDVQVYLVENDGDIVAKTSAFLKDSTDYSMKVVVDDDDYASIIYIIQD